MPTKIQGGLGIDKVQDGTVGVSDVDTELYGKITALTTINLGEAKAASGTVVDFVGIPEGVKRITVMFDGVSTNGTSNSLIQIGSASIEITNYRSTVVGLFNTAAVTASIVTNGFGITVQTSTTDVLTGSITLDNITLNSWVCSGGLYKTPSNVLNTFGSKTLSGTLDCIRITTVNGTDQFDAGTINISWEF